MNNFKLIAALFFCITVVGQKKSELEINRLLDSWHKDAAETNFDSYFSKMTENAVFIGTDATEYWNKKEFMKFSKPYFEKGKAWSFKAVKRNIFISNNKKVAWFDELLDTQMKLCRGSGVLKKIKGKWKIVHYVLSIVVPNDNVDELVKMKKEWDDTLIKKLIDN